MAQTCGHITQTSEIDTLFSTHSSQYGIIYDGSSFWIGSSTGTIYQYFDGSIGDSFQAPIFDYLGLSYDGEYLYVNSLFTGDNTIYKIDFNGNVIDSYSVPNLWQVETQFLINAPHSWMLSEFGNYSTLTLENGNVNYLENYFLDPNTYYYSLAHDGDNLWIANWDGFLYQIVDVVYETNDYAIASNECISYEYEFDNLSTQI